MKGGGKSPVSSEHGETASAKAAAAAVEAASGGGRAASRGLGVLDLILRFAAVVATVGSAVAMGTTNQTLPFFTQFLRFKAQYDDLPTLTCVPQRSFQPTNPPIRLCSSSTLMLLHFTLSGSSWW